MKHALVTGGTGGIGSAIVHALVGAGYTVTGTGRTDAEVESFPTLTGVDVLRLDITRADEIGLVLGKLAGLDAVINCAGIIQRELKEFDPEAFSHTVEVNLIGTMRVCAAARPKLAATRGSIVNTASMLSFFGSATVPGYAASKGGVMQLTKSLAAAWAPDGIRVNAIAPGWIETELTAPLAQAAEKSAAIIARTPMRRWGRADDVAGAVLFLISEQAAFITGAILPVDGGYAAN